MTSLRRRCCTFRRGDWHVWRRARHRTTTANPTSLKGGEKWGTRRAAPGSSTRQYLKARAQNLIIGRHIWRGVLRVAFWVASAATRHLWAHRGRAAPQRRVWCGEKKSAL